MEQVVRFTGLETKSGANDNGTWTLFKIKDAGGNTYVTFDEGLGGQATQLMGQPVRITWYDEPRQYTTPQGQQKTTTQHVLQSVELAPGETPVDVKLSNGASGAPQGGGNQGSNGGGRGASSPERDARIASQWALGHAHDVIQSAIKNGTAQQPVDPDVYVALEEALAAKYLEASARLVTKILGGGASSPQPSGASDQSSAWTGQQY